MRKNRSSIKRSFIPQTADMACREPHTIDMIQKSVLLALEATITISTPLCVPAIDKTYCPFSK
jgi:hypothetical protein